MRVFCCILFLVFSLFFSAALAADEVVASSVDLTPVLNPGDSLTYKVRVQASGTAVAPGATLPIPFDTTLNVVMQYTVGKPDKEGVSQVTIAAKSASAQLGEGNEIVLPPSYFPKIIAFVDKSGEIKRMFVSETTALKLPGINSRNLILLFNTYAPSEPVKVGDNWKRLVALPNESDKYDLSCTLKSIGEVSGAKAATIKTDLKIVAPADAEYSAKGSATSSFSLDNRRLLQSDAEMTAKVVDDKPNASNEEASGTIEAVVNIHIELATLVEKSAGTK